MQRAVTMRPVRGLAITIGLLLAAAAQAAVPRWSQHTQLSFQHLTQAQGLPNEIATAVAQDGQGFLWIGTMSGIARWDGYRLKVYRPEVGAERGLPDNVVQQLHADAAGRLWVGTSAAGLVRYDAQADRFVRYPVGDKGLAHVSVQAIVDDAAGGLWVGTEGGLDHVGADAATIRREPAPGPGPVKALLLGRRGTLWVGTPAGLFRRDGGAGWELVSLKSGEQPYPQSLAEDSRGRVWVGTQRHGAFVVEPGGAVQAVHESATPEGAAALEIQHVVAVAEVRPDEVWLATLGQGIVAVDTEARETRRIRHQPTLPLSLADNTLHGLFRDRSGLVWAATDRGVSRHDPRQSAVLTWFGPPLRAEGSARASTEVSWILPVDTDRFWLATHRRGIDIVDATGAVVGALRPDPKQPASALPADSVIALERAGDGSVFIATKRGLYRAGSDGRRVVRVALQGRDPAASTWALLAEGGTLWVGGHTDGLWRVDLAGGRTERVARDRGEQRLSDERVTVLAHGPAGSLWVGTRFGLNRLDAASGRVERFVPDAARSDSLANGFIGCLYTDRAGRLWVGTYGGGISVLEAGGTRFRRMGRAQGLPDENINAFIEDASGRLWVSTDDGLALIDTEAFSARALRGAEGVVLPTYWTNSAARTAAGELLFGGAGGMTIVRPDRLQPWTWRPPVVATEVQVGGRPLALPAGGAPIVVPPGANALAVEFSAADYSAPERNRYAYQLEGYDGDWVPSDATRRLAVYANLPPGDYRLLLRGSNRDGAWGERPLALPVRVLPAWYQTVWARALAVVAALMALSAIVGWRTRALRLRQAELERKVRERTAELEAVSKALEEKSRVLELTSITDPLTGLHNRRYLTQQIDVQVAASLRRASEQGTSNRAPVDTDNVFFLVDVDRFKQVNDVHGHAAGDAVLVQMGHRLRAMMRETDHLVRWGGEEFLAVARDTDARARRGTGRTHAPGGGRGALRHRRRPPAGGDLLDRLRLPALRPQRPARLRLTRRRQAGRRGLVRRQARRPRRLGGPARGRRCRRRPRRHHGFAAAGAARRHAAFFQQPRRAAGDGRALRRRPRPGPCPSTRSGPGRLKSRRPRARATFAP